MSKLSVFNPNNQPIESLPVIYGFNNGGSPGWYSAVAIAEDGEVLGGHACSHEAFMPRDLGIIEGSRQDRHEKDYRPHYPNGYRMEFVSIDHPGLKKALDINNKKADDAEAAKAACAL